MDLLESLRKMLKPVSHTCISVHTLAFVSKLGSRGRGPWVPAFTDPRVEMSGTGAS